MEFSLNLSDLFSDEIIVIDTNLLPRNFSCPGKKSACINAVSEILNTMGEASAKAQKLLTPVTSAIKFSHSNHVIYLMLSLTREKNCNGCVIGFLKMGQKDLFIFDMNGSYNERRCFCCLDFYIHESKQRQGFGKKLYDFMLCDSGVSASSIPVDRPSDKFIKFLYKHYNLRTIIPQPNHFILYEQFFFDDTSWDEDDHKQLFRKQVQPFCRLRCKPQTSIEKCITEKWSNKVEDINR